MTATLPLEKRRYTLAEFESLPQGPPNFEYDEGEIIAVASPKYTHQKILVEFAAEFVFYRRKHRTGEYFEGVDVYLPDGKVFVPDFGFLSTQNLGLVSASDEKIHGVPDMVAEITSQDANRDRGRKFHVYHANRIPWYWIVDQEKFEIEEYRWTESGYELRSHIHSGEMFRPERFPGMEFNLAEALGVTQEGENA